MLQWWAGIGIMGQEVLDDASGALDRLPTLATLVLLRGHAIIIEKGCQCKAGRQRLPPYQFEDPSPTIITHRMKEEKGKTV